MNETILIIDDFASVRLYHTSFLTRKGYCCLGAGDGAAALAILRAQPVDLILLDLVMPGMDGPAFLTQLAADPACAALPVLIITSEAARAAAILLSQARPGGVLIKPVWPTALLQGVHDLLESAPALRAPLRGATR